MEADLYEPREFRRAVRYVGAVLRERDDDVAKGKKPGVDLGRFLELLALDPRPLDTFRASKIDEVEFGLDAFSTNACPQVFVNPVADGDNDAIYVDREERVRARRRFVQLRRACRAVLEAHCEECHQFVHAVTLLLKEASDLRADTVALAGRDLLQLEVLLGALAAVPVVHCHVLVAHLAKVPEFLVVDLNGARRDVDALARLEAALDVGDMLKDVVYDARRHAPLSDTVVADAS